jgi:hypothetical protein
MSFNLIQHEDYNNLVRSILTSVCSEDLLVSETVSCTFTGSHGLDTLELDSGHGALWHGGSLLQVLEDQLATGRADRSSTVGLGVVGQPAAVGDALNHLEKSIDI